MSTTPEKQSPHVHGFPIKQIVLAVNLSARSENTADLIITASHQTSFLNSLFNFDQSPKIMHRAPCPVLVYCDEKN